MHNQFPRFSDQVACTHCRRPMDHPRWRYVGDGEYEALCQACVAWQDATFDAEQALCHALIICGIHQGKLRSAGVK